MKYVFAWLVIITIGSMSIYYKDYLIELEHFIVDLVKSFFVKEKAATGETEESKQSRFDSGVKAAEEYWR